VIRVITYDVMITVGKTLDIQVIIKVLRVIRAITYDVVVTVGKSLDT
jgi:hypothetical protein